MVQWAEFEFELSTTDKDGISKREHYEQVEKQVGHKIEATRNPTKFPKLLSYVWSAFVTLSNSRGVGFSGPAPITYQDIKALCELTGEQLSPRDIKAIKDLDNTYMRTMNV